MSAETSDPGPQDWRDSPYAYLVATRYIGPPERLAEWGDWYEKSHFPKIRQVPGVESADRYVSTADPRRSVAIYGLADLDVFQQPEYLALPGMGDWRPEVDEWRRAVAQFVEAPGFAARKDLVDGTD